MPGGSHGLGRLHVGHAVDVGQQFQLDAVGCQGRLVAVGGQLILEMEELAFQLAIGRTCLRIRVDSHVPVAAVDDDGVARVDLPQDPPHAGDGRNAATAGQDRRMTGLAAGLRDDALDLDVAQRHDLGGQQFVGHDDQRPLQRIHGARTRHVRQMRAQPHDDIPHVIEPLPQIFVFGPGEERRVFVRASDAGRPARVSRSLLIQVRIFSEKVASRRIDSCTAKMAAASCPTWDWTLACRARRSHAVRSRAASYCANSAVTSWSSRRWRVGIHEDLVDAVRGSDRDARRYGDSFSHGAQCSNPTARLGKYAPGSFGGCELEPLSCWLPVACDDARNAGVGCGYRVGGLYCGVLSMAAADRDGTALCESTVGAGGCNAVTANLNRQLQCDFR